MASYTKEREFFLVQFAKEFPNASIREARALLAAATGSQRYNEIACSIDVGDRELARLERRDTARTARVAHILANLGATLLENGDPRGFPYVIGCPSGSTYDFGGRGLGIPGRGLPTSCFR